MIFIITMGYVVEEKRILVRNYLIMSCTQLFAAYMVSFPPFLLGKCGNMVDGVALEWKQIGMGWFVRFVSLIL